jgi:predicted dehydrogenase
MKKITRRGLIATAAATNVLLAKPETAFGSQANSAVTFGVIGTGGRGRYVGTLMTKAPNAKLAAICDIFPDRIDLGKTQIPGADQVKAYRNYKELLAQKDIDAVLIATPVWLHPEHFEAAVDANKHIYCEKPAGADVAGVKRLRAAAERLGKDKTVAFGYQQRFSPEYLHAEKMLRDGSMGDLNLMLAYWIWGGNAFAGEGSTAPKPLPATEEEKVRQWHQFKELSGDFIVEQDCHGLDVLNWFAQAHPVKAIGAGGRRARKRGNNSDFANISYEYPGGLHGWLLGTQLPPNPYWDVKEQFVGTKGVMETTRNYYVWTPAGSKTGDKVESKREITNEAVEAFFNAIATGKPFSMAKDACESTLTAILGRMAFEKGRTVTWDEMMRSA